MPRVEMITQSSKDATLRGGISERLINLYPETMPEGSIARFALRAVPGTESFAALPGVFLRGLAEMDAGEDGRLIYAAIGGQAYSVDANAASIALGALPDSEDTSLAPHRGAMVYAAGGEYHVWDGATLDEITPTAFTDVGSVEFLSGYTVYTERGGTRFAWSALADPKDLPALNVATAEARDDNLLRAVAVQGNLWLFKETSAEIWGLTGLAAENAFSRLPGGVREKGLKGYNLICKVPDGAFFVGNDNAAYLLSGDDFQPASRTPVERAIKDNQPTHCFYYEDAGHKFCVIRFRDRPAWVLDLATGFWHERASGDVQPWNATHSVRAYGRWRLGEVSGTISTSVDAARDAGGELIREVWSRPLFGDGRRFRVDKLEILGKVGQADIGRAPIVEVRLSRDGGVTYGTARNYSMGDLGRYDRRIVVRSGGMGRTLVAKLRITDPADLTIYSGANLDVTEAVR